jgi:hypothetical protein
MNKLKMFANSNSFTVRGDIDKWQEENPNVNVKDVKIKIKGGQTTMVLVIYEIDTSLTIT